MGTAKNYQLLSTESYFQDLFTSLFSKNKLDTQLLIVDTRNFHLKKRDDDKNLKVAIIAPLPFTPEKLCPEADFVLPADLKLEEAEGFLQALQPQPLSIFPPPSVARYHDHLFESLTFFFRLDPANPSDIQNLRDRVHKIAGSSAIYGYPAFGRLAKELDTLLTPLLTSHAPLPSNFPSLYASFLRKALFAFQKIDVLLT